MQFTIKELHDWLAEMAYNNKGAYQCIILDIIARLPGFEAFVKYKRKEGHDDSSKEYRC